MSDKPVRDAVSACRIRAGVSSCAIVALVWALAVGATPPAMEIEVGQLLARMERSGCEFYRNGSWASAVTARAHLERKYRAMRDRNLIATTEDFIERGATRSSMSGEAYRVRCAGKPVVDSAVWFGDELQRLRIGRSEGR